jgi:hypothetical protein
MFPPHPTLKGWHSFSTTAGRPRIYFPQKAVATNLSESRFTGLKDVQDKLVFLNPNDLKTKNPEGMAGL